MMFGKIISREELQARWSYSEMTGRFAADYPSGPLKTKIEQRALFESLSAAEHTELTQMNLTGLRKGMAWTMANITHYRCESWTKEQFLRLHALLILDPTHKNARHVPLLSFFMSPRFRNPDGSLQETDPRVQADKVPLEQLFVQRDPLIIGYWPDGVQVLFEGYFRAHLFLRSENPNAQILLWVPHAGSVTYT
jgi:hypothetical protein